MNDKLKPMCVLAHPDDESMGMGGTLARYAAEGIETYLVTATLGQQGWPAWAITTRLETAAYWCLLCASSWALSHLSRSRPSGQTPWRRLGKIQQPILTPFARCYCRQPI